MEKDELNDLLNRYLKGECSEDERALIETWYLQTGKPTAGISEREIEEDVAAVRGRLSRRPIIRMNAGIRYAVAAAVLAMVTTVSIYFIRWRNTAHSPVQQVMVMGDDIRPGGNKATLILSDGRAIELRDNEEGIIVGDEITYNDGSPVVDQTSAPRLLTLSTPKGGQYQMTLPDGTKVWLNAASSLEYSPVNSGKERMVRLKGEAYFEVAKDKEHPFKVTTDNQLIEVLGTHFNVSSYPDETTVKTTLVEGSVKVVDRIAKQEVILKPGDQAVSGGHDSLHVLHVATADATAWKDGLFRFDNTDIETIMRQLSRWYDVEVIFEGKKPDIKLWGEVYRNVNAAQALEILTYFNLKYRVETENGIKRIVISS